MEGLYRANILGRERDIYFGMPAIDYVFEKIDFSTIQRINQGDYEVSDLKTIAHFVYGGLWGGVERKDEVKDFDFGNVYSEVERWTLDGDFTTVQIVGQAFSESYAIQKLLKALKPVKGVKKKKKPTTKS